MLFPDSFEMSTPSDREIRVTRDFDAPRRLVWGAFTKPELVRRWLLGPPGWTMPLCEIDLRAGGSYRYVWRCEKDGAQMAMAGVFREVIAPERLVATEKFDDAWYPGEALGTTVFAETRGITRATITVLYESRAARDTARRSGMEHGMAAGYDRLEGLLPAFNGERPCIETPQVVQTPAQRVAILHIQTPRSKMQQVMGPGIGEAMAAVKAQGLGPAGPWFAHHLKMTPEGFDFDICVPVSAPVTAVGRVRPGQRPEVKVVRTVYHGRYEGLDGAWREFTGWIEANGYKTAVDLYECYVVGPESSPDPADWRTELSRPVIE